jgi:hypothetical protein
MGFWLVWALIESLSLMLAGDFQRRLLLLLLEEWGLSVIVGLMLKFSAPIDVNWLFVSLSLKIGIFGVY